MPWSGRGTTDRALCGAVGVGAAAAAMAGMRELGHFHFPLLSANAPSDPSANSSPYVTWNAAMERLCTVNGRPRGMARSIPGLLGSTIERDLPCGSVHLHEIQGDADSPFHESTLVLSEPSHRLASSAGGIVGAHRRSDDYCRFGFKTSTRDLSLRRLPQFGKRGSLQQESRSCRPFRLGALRRYGCGTFFLSPTRWEGARPIRAASRSSRKFDCSLLSLALVKEAFVSAAACAFCSGFP